MSLKKPLKIRLFQAANILVAVFLLTTFFVAGQTIIETFRVADITSLNNLAPKQMDYLWKLNIYHVPLDENKMHLYTDYYEHLLQVFPNAWEAYGLLGYCYHYLNDDAKAIKFLKTAIQTYPGYFWNYYNLAIIYINEGRYQEAIDLLQQAVDVDPMSSLRKMASSPMVYVPVLGVSREEVVTQTEKHLKETYQASFVLKQVLSQLEDRNQIQEVIRKIHPELYAF